MRSAASRSPANRRWPEPWRRKRRRAWWSRRHHPRTRSLGLAGSTISADDWRRTYAEAYRRIATHLAGGGSVIFDHANLTRAERDQVRAIGQRAGAHVQFLYVAVPEDVVRQRWRTNRQSGERYDVPDEMFELAMRAFQAPDGEPDVLKIETFTRASG